MPASPTVPSTCSTAWWWMSSKSFKHRQKRIRNQQREINRQREILNARHQLQLKMRSLKQLFKTIIKYRLSSGLTLISLVVAFLGIIVLSLYVSYEQSFDGFHENKDDIYLMSFD